MPEAAGALPDPTGPVRGLPGAAAVGGNARHHGAKSSGKKYKKCCMASDEAAARSAQPAAVPARRPSLASYVQEHDERDELTEASNAVVDMVQAGTGERCAGAASEAPRVLKTAGVMLLDLVRTGLVRGSPGRRPFKGAHAFFPATLLAGHVVPMCAHRQFANQAKFGDPVFLNPSALDTRNYCRTLIELHGCVRSSTRP